MSDQCSKWIIKTLDPVHVGTGGMTLGRVDNSIVREPGTRLPKIPGTSLSGAVRQYASYQYGNPQCAGQGPHCGNPDCPVCVTFGTANESAQSGVKGRASFGDARLLLFPVYSMIGPVWVTSPETLRDCIGNKLAEAPTGTQAFFSNDLPRQDYLNLGWLMVQKQTVFDHKLLPTGIDDAVRERTIVVSDPIFSRVVNANLEVRTSVSIDPETGAAKKGALFTYEAIPRTTFLFFDLLVDTYRGQFPEITKKYGSDTEPLAWRDVDAVVEAGFALAAILGIGGMGTRGFGRVEAWRWPEVES